MPPIDVVEKHVERDGPETIDNDDDTDVEVRRTTDLARTSETVRRAYGADKGTPQIDLVDF